MAPENRLAVACLLVVSFAPEARADKHDLVLSRLGAFSESGEDVIANNQEFRSLASELGVVMAPKFLAGADTLGFSGFQFSTQLAFTTISKDQDFWCATEETSGCTGGAKDTGTLSTLGFFARKGMWLPVPSFEVGIGAIHLVDSRMWGAQLYGKIALHEGFHDWPVPSVAVRGAASRLLGSEQLDLTVASVDVTVSKMFGVASVMSLEPYVGMNWLWIVPRSEVVDKTPHIDPLADPANMSDLRMNFVFPAQDNITRTRFFGGLQLKYDVFAFIAEVNVALSGTSTDDRPGTTACENASGDGLDDCDATDGSGSQTTYSLAVALDF